MGSLEDEIRATIAARTPTPAPRVESVEIPARVRRAAERAEKEAAQRRDREREAAVDQMHQANLALLQAIGIREMMEDLRSFWREKLKARVFSSDTLILTDLGFRHSYTTVVGKELERRSVGGMEGEEVYASYCREKITSTHDGVSVQVGGYIGDQAPTILRVVSTYDGNDRELYSTAYNQARIAEIVTNVRRALKDDVVSRSLSGLLPPTVGKLVRERAQRAIRQQNALFRY